ncbi:MAG TPA: NUDIX hydrolase [Clostridiales bacterium]|nr:NUDIX hydrolase [Clostridiales bacterium]
MIFRECAGGIIFHGDKVFLLQNEKGEWVFPKGVIRHGKTSTAVALARVKEESNIDASILSAVGETSYEFYSITRNAPVCNRIVWFLMTTDTPDFVINKDHTPFQDGGFFSIIDAFDKVTYSQDKSLLNIAYRKLKEL